MKSKDYKAFIVEGETREPLIIRNLCRVFFKHCNFKIITLPAGQNIYMLWQRLKADDFETDMIELLRESSTELEEALAGLTRDDFSEIFLFFDYDGHQDNLSSENSTEDVMEQMLENFDNETENGKLYINYPMVEALRDFKSGFCDNKNGCYFELGQADRYKSRSADGNVSIDFRKYDFEVWSEILNVFAMRVSCLFGEEKVMSHEAYSDLVNPCSVYNCQQKYISEGKVFILSAFPEFLSDYFSVKFWRKCIKCRQRLYESCVKDIF